MGSSKGFDLLCRNTRGAVYHNVKNLWICFLGKKLFTSAHSEFHSFINLGLYVQINILQIIENLSTVERTLLIFYC